MSNEYQGPAKLEVFGKDEHVGWVRAGSERIDILTVDGEAIQVDSRARFRLTPITWQELADQGLRAQKSRDRNVAMLRDDIVHVRHDVDERDKRIEDLRRAIFLARAGIADATKPGTLVSSKPFADMDALLEKALDDDDAARETNTFPF